MCGYCIEENVIIGFIGSSQEQEKKEIDGIFMCNYLQECEDLIGFIEKAKTFDSFRGWIDIVIYRLCDEYITHGYNKFIYDAIKSAFTLEFINNYLEKKTVSNEPSYSEDVIMHKIFNQDIYEDSQCWDVFIKSYQNRSQLEETLYSYCDWWVLANKKKFGDPSHTWIKDELYITTRSEADKFYSLFPAVFFSLSLLKKFYPNSNAIRSIALNSPHRCPNFGGYELWLQRKAFEFCVKEDGVEFMLSNLDKIRIELVCYALLKCFLEVNELKMLSEALILSEQHSYIYNVEGESILELVNRLIYQRTKH